MSLCNSIFFKDIYSLTIEDLVSFFSVEQEEMSILEFKSGKVELEHIYREVSAFLNTEGGILILGSPIEKKTGSGIKEKKTCQGELMPTNFKSLDSLIRSIASNISPSPSHIKLKQLEFSNGWVFVLEIPQSSTPPHQVSNEGKYYIRLERDSKPAPHGIVEALFLKRQKPNIDIGFHLYQENDKESIFIEFILKNHSVITAENPGIMISISGVDEILSSKNVGNPEIIDQTVSFQTTTLPILVKNISLTFKYEINIPTNLILLEATFWAKDTQAETRASIFNPDKEKFDFIRSYNSKEDNENLKEDLYQVFINKNHLNV